MTRANRNQGKNQGTKKKVKPMAGGIRIQQLCPVPTGQDWRVILLGIVGDDTDEAKLVVDEDGDPVATLVDIACWALLVEEDKDSRYQEIWACVPNDDGVVEPIPPDAASFAGIVPPGYDEDDIAVMISEKVDELDLPTVVDDKEDEGDDDKDDDGVEGDDDKEDEGDEEGVDDDEA